MKECRSIEVTPRTIELVKDNVAHQGYEDYISSIFSKMSRTHFALYKSVARKSSSFWERFGIALAFDTTTKQMEADNIRLKLKEEYINVILQDIEDSSVYIIQGDNIVKVPDLTWFLKKITGQPFCDSGHPENSSPNYYALNQGAGYPQLKEIFAFFHDRIPTQVKNNFLKGFFLGSMPFITKVENRQLAFVFNSTSKPANIPEVILHQRLTELSRRLQEETENRKV